MKLTWVRPDPPIGGLVVRLEFTEDDLTVMRPMTGFDSALLNECDGEDASIADRLLGLELVARRVEEAVTPHP